MARKTALVICPGRGTYNKDDLGYLARHHADKAEFIGAVDAARQELGQETVSALDGAGLKLSLEAWRSLPLIERASLAALGAESAIAVDVGGVLSLPTIDH